MAPLKITKINLRLQGCTLRVDNLRMVLSDKGRRVPRIFHLNLEAVFKRFFGNEIIRNRGEPNLVLPLPLPRKQVRSARTTDRARYESVRKVHPLLRQLINMRSRRNLRPIHTQRVIAHIIRQNENHIRLSRLNLLSHTCAHERKHTQDK